MFGDQSPCRAFSPLKAVSDGSPVIHPDRRCGGGFLFHVAFFHQGPVRMNRMGIVFCTLAMFVTLAVFALLVPAAMVSQEVAATGGSCKTLSDDIEVELQGTLEGISIWDLIRYYLENPPATGSAIKERQFGGC